MNPQKNNEVAEWMRGLGFEYQNNVERWVAPQDSPWKVYAMSTEQAAFFYAAVAEAQKAYGGCTNCYGKGYASVNDRWLGHDTDTDIGSPGGYISGGDANAMKFCSCDRGKELERRIAALRGKR